jgi:hypothetical protein
MWLKELVHESTLASDYPTTFNSLTSKLAALKVHTVTRDQEKGEIVVLCLTGPINATLWRCWSDKLIFEIKRIDTAKTEVRVYAVPNLLRHKIRDGEKEVELQKLISELSL